MMRMFWCVGGEGDIVTLTRYVGSVKQQLFGSAGRAMHFVDKAVSEVGAIKWSLIKICDIVICINYQHWLISALFQH